MPRSIEHIRRTKREHMARKRAADPAAARAYRNAYHAANRDRQTEIMRTYYARRFFWGRAMKLRGVGRASAKDLARLWKSQRGKCALTGRALNRAAQVDHILPRGKGGGDAATNLRWVCAEINYAKRDLTDDQLVALCGEVMNWIGRRIESVESLMSSPMHAAAGEQAVPGAVTIQV